MNACIAKAIPDFDDQISPANIVAQTILRICSSSVDECFSEKTELYNEQNSPVSNYPGSSVYDRIRQKLVDERILPEVLRYRVESKKISK